jgi:benzoyl-CoA reductase/2-hydroxyglutaryl-CoA dehydratase subunit BcrC/BadD/HgdB
MLELLRLCGLEAREAESQLPRIERAFRKLGITAPDIERGKQRLSKYYDIKLKGVRRLLRLGVLELVNSVLSREEGKTRVVYGFMAPCFSIFSSALVSASKGVFAAHQTWAFQFVVGCIFDKMVPVLEAAEEKWLKAGVVAHCSNVKSLVGLFALNLIPKPDLLITSGYLCETAPKTIDLLHELYGIPVCCYDTCQDREFNNYSTATERAISLATKSLRRLIAKVQEVVGFEVTDDMLQEVIDARRRLNDAVGRLRELIESSDPLPLSSTHDTLLMALNSLTLSIDGLSEATEAINTLYEELQERVSKGVGVVEKGAPRILAILPSHHTDPRLEYLVGEMGMAIVTSDPSFNVPYEGVVKDPYVEMALYLQQSLFTTLSRRVPLIIEGCKRLNIDGVLNRFHVGCRTVAGDALIIDDAVRKELKIPVLLLEWENFDPRVYNHDEYKSRLEALKTMLAEKSR